jgi:3-deoxy-D-manno-octulosonic-acid transferase
MYLVYSILLLAALVALLPIYWVRNRFIRRESLHLRERLGWPLPDATAWNETLWIHAVSVGEVLSLQKLLERIRSRHPDWKVLVSSLTHSGLTLAREKLPQADGVICIPLDFRWNVRRFMRAIQPRVLVLVESEIWPHLLREAGRWARSVLVINGRISARTGRRYFRVKRLMRRVLEPVDLFQVQTPADRSRLEEIGIEPERIQVCGNLKAEISLPVFGSEEVERRKRALGLAESHGVVVAGSTHRGEEEPLLRAFAAARKSRPGLRLILAPRHIDRIPEVIRLMGSQGVRACLRSGVKPEDDWDALILDTLGELAEFYALADAAFIGGSLIPWGGQNLLEPAFYAKPVFFGPHMNNFAHLVEIFLRNDAARVVKGEGELEAMFLMENRSELERMGARARKTLESLRGATEHALNAIESGMSS